jgi:hypothetical protein
VVLLFVVRLFMVLRTCHFRHFVRTKAAAPGIGTDGKIVERIRLKTSDRGKGFGYVERILIILRPGLSTRLFSEMHSIGDWPIMINRIPP